MGRTGGRSCETRQNRRFGITVSSFVNEASVHHRNIAASENGLRHAGGDLVLPDRSPHREGRIMQAIIEQQPTTIEVPFVDRRLARPDGQSVRERRQFQDSREAGRPEVNELAAAVDLYKLTHHRRFITFEELFDVMTSLGYRK